MTAQDPTSNTRLSLPYGEACLEVEPRGPAVALRAKSVGAPIDVAKAARDAVVLPDDGPPLEQLARGAKRVVVVLSDATRSLPQGPMVEAVLEALPGREVAFLVGSGLHGPSPRQALGLTEETLGKYPLHQHDPRDAGSLVRLGALSHQADLDLPWLALQAARGAYSFLRRPSLRGMAGRLFRGVLAVKAASANHLVVNRLCAEADLIVAMGQITPHFLTGYSGGIKAVVPGTAGRSTIVGNHLKILHASARLGLVDGNVVRAELESAADLLPPIFILNLIPGADGRPVGLVAGDPVGAHRAGVKLARAVYEIVAPRAEAVIVGAANPKALNLYQLMKVLPAAARVVRPGGAVCVAGPCPKGMGASTLLRQIIFPCYMETLLPPYVELMLLSRLPDKEITSATPFRPVATLEEAVSRLRARAGPEGLLAVMDGSGPVVPLVAR